MNNYKMLTLNLHLFDGAAAGGGATAGAAPSGDGGAVTGGKTGNSKDTGVKVLYGKQPTAEAEGAADNTTPAAEGTKPSKADITTTSDTKEAKRAEYMKLVREEYKEFFDEDVHGIIGRRFKDTKGLEERLATVNPVLDMMMSKYNITDGDPAKLQKAIEQDTKYWEEAADKAGMTVEGFKQFKQMERDLNATKQAEQYNTAKQQAEQQLNKWFNEGNEVKAIYPNFDLKTELANPDFKGMLKSGISVKHAYQTLHMDDILSGAVQYASKTTEQRVVDNIRARGTRPAENGVGNAQTGVIVKDDVRKLTAKDRENAIREAQRGKTVSF